MTFHKINVANDDSYIISNAGLADVYDFDGGTLTTLTISSFSSSITVKNLVIRGQVIVQDECRHCKFENVVFERISSITEDNKPLPLVSFGYGTAGTIFDKCIFKGYNSNGDYVMKSSLKRKYSIYTYHDTLSNKEKSTLIFNANEDRAINDTLVMTNCTFKNLECVIRATKKFNCVIEGGWFENVKSIIHNNGEFTDHNIESLDTSNVDLEEISTIISCSGLNANIFINGIAIENVDYIYRSRKADGDNTNIFNFTNIVVNGMLGEVDTAVVDYTAGSVNLEYNSKLSPQTKLFNYKSDWYNHSNIELYGVNSYKVLSVPLDYTVSFNLAPNETLYPFGDLYVANINWSAVNSNGVDLSFESVTETQTVNQAITSGSTVSVSKEGRIKISNESSEYRNITVTINTNSKLY